MILYIYMKINLIVIICIMNFYFKIYWSPSEKLPKISSIESVWKIKTTKTKIEAVSFRFWFISYFKKFIHQFRCLNGEKKNQPYQTEAKHSYEVIHGVLEEFLQIHKVRRWRWPFRSCGTIWRSRYRSIGFKKCSLFKFLDQEEILNTTEISVSE